MRRILAVFAVLVVGLSLGLFVKVRENRAALTAPSGGSGIVEGLEVDVVSRLPARIVEITVDEGDPVKAGQVLVRLDCREQEALLRAAKAKREATASAARAAQAQVEAALGAADAAKAQVGAADAQRKALETSEGVAARQLARLEKLKGQGGATEMDLDRAGGQRQGLEEQIRALDATQAAARGQAKAARGQAEAARAQAEAAIVAITAAEADVARAETLVEECTLEAPIDGYVLTRAFEPQEVTLPGSKVLALVKIDPVETSFYIPNAELAEARVGRKVRIVADAWPDRAFEGEIVAVSQEAEFTPRNVQTRQDRDRLVYRVEVRAPNPESKLRPGMPVQISIPGSAKE